MYRCRGEVPYQSPRSLRVDVNAPMPEPHSIQEDVLPRNSTCCKEFLSGEMRHALKIAQYITHIIMDKERKYICTIVSANRAINGSAKIALHFDSIKEIVKDAKGKESEKTLKTITIADKNGNDVESDTITLSYRNFLKGIAKENLPTLKKIVTLICGGNPRKFSKVQNLCVQSVIGGKITFVYQHLQIGDKTAANTTITKPMWQMGDCLIENAKDASSEDISFINLFGGFTADCDDKGLTKEEKEAATTTKLSFME